MTKPFIAHSDASRTFASKKGATAAIKRDLSKHTDKHGSVLFETGFDVLPVGDDKFGVVVYCDLTPSEALEKVGEELHGYVIQPSIDEKAKTTPVNKRDGGPSHKDDYPAPSKGRRKGVVDVAPSLPLVACRAGSVQHKMVEYLSRQEGATIDQLKEVCQKTDGSGPWAETSIRSAFYYDLKDKGYGTRTEMVEGVPTYFLVLPEGYDVAPAPRAPKT